MRETGVLTAPLFVVSSRRPRRRIEHQRPDLARRRPDSVPLVRQREARHFPQRSMVDERVGHERHHPLAVVHAHRIHVPPEKGCGIRRGGMTAHHDRGGGRRAAHACREREDFVSLERVHSRDPDEAGSLGLEIALDGTAETEVGQRNGVAARLQSGCHIGHAQRLDAKERSEPEPFVSRNRPQQQYAHR
jgi:hypothetical protein